MYSMSIHVYFVQYHRHCPLYLIYIYRRYKVHVTVFVRVPVWEWVVRSCAPAVRGAA